MTYRTRNIMIAVALAVIAALLTSFYVSNYKRNVQNAETSVAVWVAARDIPASTSGKDIVARNLLLKRDVARRNVVPGAISDPAQIEGQILTQAVYAGEQVTARRFGTPSEVGVHGQLKGTLRAIVVPGKPEQLLVGTLRAGDHVDVVVDVKSDDDHWSRVVLRDLLVLKASQNDGTSGKIANGISDGASVMLAVRDRQASKLHWAVADGREQEWTLALRAPVDAADSPNNMDTLHTFVNDAISKVELNRAGVR